MLWSSFFLSDGGYILVPTLNRHHSGHTRGSPVCGRGMLRHQPPRYTRHFLVPLERVLRCLEIGNYWIIGGKTLEGPSCCAAPFVYVLTQRFYLLTQPCYEPAIYTPQCCRPCDSSSICCTYTVLVHSLVSHCVVTPSWATG